MVTTLCASAAVVLKAGGTAKILEDSQYTELINQAEGNISVRTRKDWVGVYAGLNDSVKKILEEGTSNLAAMYVINNDLDSISSSIKGQTQLDVLQDGYLRVLGILNDKKNETFILKA